MKSEKSHHSRSKTKDSSHRHKSSSAKKEILSSTRSKNTHKEGHHRGYSADRHKHTRSTDHQERKDQVSNQSSSSSSREPSPTSKQQQLTKNDPCVSGPDIYTNVLGPTPDETLLVGLQTFLGFCTGRSGDGPHEIEENHHSEEEEEEEEDTISYHEPNTEDLSTASHHEPTENKPDDIIEEIPQNINQSDLPDIEKETEIENITESQFRGDSLVYDQSTELEILNVKAQTNSDIVEIPTVVDVRSTSTEKIDTIDSEAQSPSVSTINRESQTDNQITTEKSLDTSELSISTGEMLNSEHSSQTDYPSQESRTSQTLSEKRQRKPCICKLLTEETNSEPALQKNHCTCPPCCNKRRCRTTKKCKPALGGSKSKYRCLCNSPSAPVNAAKDCHCSSSDASYTTEDDDNMVVKNGQMGIVKYAITKITKFCNYTTFEIMKSTKKKPKVMPATVEGVFVLKNNKP